MKKILYIIFAASLLLLASCEKFMKPSQKLIGDWHCTASTTKAEIYVTFNEDNTFVLYQQINEGAFRVYNGMYSLTESADGSAYILSGAYNDGAAWGTEYEMQMTGNYTMILTAGGISEKYEKLPAGIPAEVLKSCVTVVKSEYDQEVAFL